MSDASGQTASNGNCCYQTDTAESFNPADTSCGNSNGCWSALATTLPMARNYMSSAAVATDDGQVAIVGGMASIGNIYYNNVDLYDPTTNTWSTGTTYPTEIRYVAVVAVPQSS